MGIRFEATFPEELEGLIEPEEYNPVINRINEYFEEAEKANGYTFLEGCLGCITFFSTNLCMQSRYDKFLELVDEHIDDQNQNLFKSKNLKMSFPSKNGFQFLEIVYKDMSEKL
uniref:Ras modification protein ERF4 n=1 Tax=Arcella intermedia TaxID=1963864 RepID=A0A6B2LQX6_9EUKA